MRNQRTRRPVLPAAIAVAVALALLSVIAPASRPVAAQGSVTIDIVDFAFSGGSITIEAGTTVTWVNQGAVNHTATGDGGSFDTGQIAPGGSGSITFDTPGPYGYFCANHPDMIGAITVVAASTDDGSTDDGTTDDGSTNDGSTDDTEQLPTTGVGIRGDGLGGMWAVLSALAVVALIVAFAAGAVRRQTI